MIMPVDDLRIEVWSVASRSATAPRSLITAQFVTNEMNDRG
jgi:hypothetical protein